MSKNLPFYVVVIGVLSILAVLLVSGEHIRRENEQAIIKNPGDDETSRLIRYEAYELVRVNKRQQLGLLVTGGIFLAVAFAWRIALNRRDQTSRTTNASK